MTPLEELKFNIREGSNSYFAEEELQAILDQAKTGEVDGVPVYDIYDASYRALIIKAEDDSIKLPGLDIPSSQQYYLRLARLYRGSCFGTMKRVDEI